ncbi:hypothetical protein Fcan01_17616 [Folsomia candida]|uniref:Uncharacterized protein n=1 Tax=Folsomia candida TaxID=158441 RepID=A0A226DPF5_FOLCA|nr:hypothetical protein Fcan01_17616 [Folsomia candida]
MSSNSKTKRIFIDELDTTGMETFKTYPLVEQRRVKGTLPRRLKQRKNQWKGLHHTPPRFRIEFVPLDLEKFGLKFKGLIQESEVDKQSISKARLDQQLEFWNNPLLEETTINSLLVTSIFKESPYEYFDYRDEGPMIGIYKRSGNTKGQAISELTATGKKTDEFNLQFDQQSCFYDPVNFLYLGVSRDFVITGQPETVKLDELVDKLIYQQENFGGGDMIYPVGSVDVLYTEVNRTILFALLKTRGTESGQRIWFSCHELQHLLEELVKRVKIGVAQLQSETNG